MSNNKAFLNSQLIFGVKISDDFSAIIEEYDLFSFNHEDDIFFRIGDYSILGITPPHEEEYNTKHHILFAYEENIETVSKTPFKETLQELKTEFDSFYQQDILSLSDYQILLEELKALHTEKPQLFLFSEDSYQSST